jgi:hypothetical protein
MKFKILISIGLSHWVVPIRYIIIPFIAPTDVDFQNILNQTT